MITVLVVGTHDECAVAERCCSPRFSASTQQRSGAGTEADQTPLATTSVGRLLTPSMTSETDLRPSKHS